jgi:hypothetical protein
VNDAKTFTRSGLGFLSNLAAGQPDAPVKPLLGLTIPTREYQNGLGGTLSFSHLLNYTAKDAEFGRGSHPQLDAMVGIKIITQMHEAANTVSIQTGISVPPALDGSNDRDAGEAVEDCMAKKLTGGR